MVVPGRLTAALSAGLLMLACAWSAAASGPSATAPWYLDQYGGDAPDMKTFYAGRVGVVMPTAPRPQLFISWRNLHGLKVGQAAGEALSQPCCDAPGWARYDFDAGWRGWVKARLSVPGSKEIAHEFERGGPNDTTADVCFEEAFDLASATLKARQAQHGAGSSEVRAWLAAQDSVFAACTDPAATMPALPSGAPAWLAKDHAYQVAAQALYADRYIDAAKQFAVIGKDLASPWRGYGPYLEARALEHLAITIKTPAGYELAEAALARLAATSDETFGHSQAHNMRSFIALKRDSKAYFADLTREMSAPAVEPDVAIRFRDFSDLADAQPVKPEMLDWMATLRAKMPDLPFGAAPEVWARKAAEARQAAQTHAEQRWRAGHDVAWLIAAMSLTDPGAANAPALLADARTIPRTSAGWLSVQHHAIRLTLASTPPGQSRHGLDAILARKDLSVSDRNLFTAQRTQVAANLDDFVRHALRKRLCPDLNNFYIEAENHRPPTCARSRWDDDVVQPAGVYDGVGDKGRVGFGEDARAILDRAPLSFRMAVAADKRIPPNLRLDVALTSYGRAVLLQDNAAIDILAGQLAGLVPLMASEFNGVVAARPGPDKRFAEFLVLAKIPGVRTDLPTDYPGEYERPAGRRVVDFQSHWADWMIAPARGVAGMAPPPLAAYQHDGFGIEFAWRSPPGTPDTATDLTCLGECGRGAAPLRMPDFISAGQARAERVRFTTYEQHYGDGPNPVYPPGGVDVWEEMLAYAQAHPADPRVPEALHWLVHVGHFGGSHNHSGRRAFKVLHARYEGSYWAKKTPYYND